MHIIMRLFKDMGRIETETKMFIIKKNLHFDWNIEWRMKKNIHKSNLIWNTETKKKIKDKIDMLMYD